VNSDLLVLNAMIRRELGVDFSENLDQLARKTRARRLATGVPDLRRYIALLEDGSAREAEWFALADAVANNETYFFREASQIDVICRFLIPPLVASRARDEFPPRPVRLLSVPCSTGEEPYSIVMQLIMNHDGFEGNLHIFAGDLSERALRVARLGRYRPLSFRSTSADILHRFFRKRAGWTEIVPSVAKHVTFFRANLVDLKSLQVAAPYDIIVCRNVLIYFSPPTRLEVMRNLSAVLAPDGFLCLGHADELDGLEEYFEPVLYGGVIVHRGRQRA
jgi:chemotaxis protein methyltransferase CheR